MQAAPLDGAQVVTLNGPRTLRVLNGRMVVGIPGLHLGSSTVCEIEATFLEQPEIQYRVRVFDGFLVDPQARARLLALFGLWLGSDPPSGSSFEPHADEIKVQS